MTLRNYALLFCLLTASACSNTRHLPAGESLFVGGDVNITETEAPKAERKVLRSDLSRAIRPKPNSKVLGMRIKLAAYNLAGGDSVKKRNFFQRILYNFGEPPVLASSVHLDHNRDAFYNVLENRGYFRSDVSARLETKRRKTKAIFDVRTGPQYKIRNVEFETDSSQISLDIHEIRDKTLLSRDQPYNLDLIKGERDRIDKSLTEKGYYYFKPDYILVRVDSTIGNNQVDMYVTLKRDEIPPEVYQRFHINDVYIFPNYRINSRRQDTSLSEAAFTGRYYVVDRRETFRPIVFEQSMHFKPGELYNRTDQNTSLRRLVSLGTFKFVKNRFEPIDTGTGALLDVYYYLTPYPKKSLRIEAGGHTQSDSRAGTSLVVSWRNRNTFRGAELFTVRVRGGYESQYGGTVKRPALFTGGVETALSIPRFVVPFFNVQSSSKFIPWTHIRADYTLETRNLLYQINTIRGSYGYSWKEEIRKDHRFFPINITYVRTDTVGTSEQSRNINFSNLIFNGLIIGPTYEFTYNSLTGLAQRNKFYFNGLADFSGNILGLVQGAKPESPKKIFGANYAQYMKYQVDFRHYLQWAPDPHNVLASRIIVGVGLPYGNSSQLPNVKQFFSGGNSSLRGFRSRLVGPGTYNERYLYGTNTFLESLGDIKLEFNTEFRANLYQFLNGAVFLDAGNIWLAKENPSFPGGHFTSNWINELAADVGVGLRFDFQILILRLDLATPIRKPWLPEGERMVFNQINFGSPEWRRDNLILNIAIGYPF